VFGAERRFVQMADLGCSKMAFRGDEVSEFCVLFDVVFLLSVGDAEYEWSVGYRGSSPTIDFDR